MTIASNPIRPGVVTDASLEGTGLPDDPLSVANPTTVNGADGAVTIQGVSGQVDVNTVGGVIIISIPFNRAFIKTYSPPMNASSFIGYPTLRGSIQTYGPASITPL